MLPALFQRALQTDLISSVSGQFQLTADVLLVPAYSNLVANYLFNVGFVDAEAKQGVALVLTEMLMNAIEHGNCGITQAEKHAHLERHGDIQALIGKKLRDPVVRARRVHYSYDIHRDHSVHVIRDEGPGFNWREHLHPREDAPLDLLAERVREGVAAWPAARRPDVALVFSAHSLPMSFIERGDPYAAAIAETVGAVVSRLAGDAPAYSVLSYQSQTGPVRWLEPRTDRVIEELGHEGMRDVLVVPVSFVSDHIETLYEVDQLFGDAAARAGITTFRRTRSLNDDPAFIAMLAGLVEQRLDAGTEPREALCASA